MKITGIVLAGGRSRRMGTDKSLVELNGKTLLAQAITLLEKITPSILVSSNNPGLSVHGFPVIADTYPQIGPISGLYSALSASASEFNIVLPCDTPCVGVSLYQKVLEGASGFDAIVAGTPNGLIEPLIGYYHRSAKNVLRDQIELGDYKLQNALQRMNTKIVLFADRSRFININTRQDLTSAELPTYHIPRIGESLTV